MAKEKKNMKNPDYKGEGHSAKAAIKAYLDKRAATDELFAKSYAKPNKSIGECYNYIISEARKRRAECMTDEEVFGLAVHYYDEDDIKVPTAPLHRATTTATSKTSKTAPAVVELTEEEKAAAKAEVLRKYQAEVRAEAEAKQRAAAKKPKPSPKIESPSLFDF